MTRTLLIDGDITAFKMSVVAEKEIDWGDGIVTLHADVDMTKFRIGEYVDALADRLKADEVVFALSDKENFRYGILPAYKHNRSGKRKPLALSMLREWMQEAYTVFVRPRLEGDDVLGILLTSPKIIPGEKVCVSIDKDLKTIPGLHHADKKGAKDEIVEVSEDEADYFHLHQTLTGDTTDGYAGCPKVGAKTADKILEAAGDDPVDRWLAIVAAYEKAGLGEQEALRQARVARILRRTDYNFKTKEPILWQPNTTS